MALLILPIAIFFVVSYEMSLISPLYSHQTFGSDPAYQYLFNGMGIVRGFSPAHVDHPGTPLQMLIGAVSVLFWAAQSAIGFEKASFEDSVFTDPERYLSVIGYVLLMLNTGAIYFLGREVAKFSGSLATAIFVQSGFLLFSYLLPHLAYVSPDALLVASVAMLAAYLCPALFDRSEPLPLGKIAFCFGLGVTSKLTFVPLLALMIVIPGWRERSKTGFLFVAFSALLVLPAWPGMLRMFEFAGQMMTHTGMYGTGAPGFIDPSNIRDHIAELWAATPILFVALATAVLATAAGLVVKNRSALVCGLAFSAVILLQLIISMKHFGVRYVIPSLSVSSLIIAWSIWSLKIRFARMTIYPATIAALFLAFASVRTCISGYADGYDARSREMTPLRDVLSHHPNALVIGAYYVRDINFAKQFGLLSANAGYQQMFPKMKSIVSYNRWDDVLFVGSEVKPTVPYIRSVLASGREVILYLQTGLSLPGLQYSLLHETKDGEALYLSAPPDD